MFPFRKALREPRKVAFYAWLHVAARLRPWGPRVAMLGAGHTRPNLSWKIFRLLHLREVGPDAAADLAYYHVDDTRVPGASDALNGGCIDIGKDRVAAVFTAVSGYDLAVDLSDDEIGLALRPARAIGLDLSSMWQTPHSPADQYLGLGGVHAMHLAAAAFRRQFLSIPRR